MSEATITAPAAVDPNVAAVTPPVVAAPVVEAVVAPVVLEETVVPPVVEQKAPVADAAGIVTYEPTGDPGMDMALEFAGNLGIGMDHPAMVATGTGDWSLLEAHLATLGDKAKGFERMVALAKDADGRLTKGREDTAAKITAAIGGVLGDTQADVMAWASAEASPEEKGEINAMLRGSPVQARAAAMLLQALYNKAGGTTITPKSAIGDASGTTPSQGDTSRLTRQQFAEMAGKLNRVHGASYQSTSEYAALSRRLG